MHFDHIVAVASTDYDELMADRRRLCELHRLLEEHWGLIYTDEGFCMYSNLYDLPPLPTLRGVVDAAVAAEKKVRPL